MKSPQQVQGLNLLTKIQGCSKWLSGLRQLVIHNTLEIGVYVFFYLIEQHSMFLLHTLQVLDMCTFCDSTNINTIIDLVPHVSSDGFNGGPNSYLQFRDTHALCLLKPCIPPSNGIVRWWLFPEFGAKFPLDHCTSIIILNNPAFLHKLRWHCLQVIHRKRQNRGARHLENICI